MATTVSQPVRIAAALGLAAALALGGVFMILGRKSTTTAAPIVPKHRIHRVAPAHAKTAAQTSARHAAKTVPAAVKAPRPAAELTALRAGLPPRLARALGQYAVVVVALTDPQSEVDGISFAEARAGAEIARAGFIPLNVLSQADVGKLTEQIGQVLPDPGILVYTRPGKLAARIDGFADKDTVAQAALNAARGL